MHRSPRSICLHLITLAGVIVPRRLRSDWKQEWEAELLHREATLQKWDQLGWRNKLDIFRKSLGAFLDALALQPRRLEENMFQDLRYGVRMLLKERVFTLVAIASLALGIGANTAIFSLVDALLLRSLPVSNPDQLVLFGNAEDAGLTNAFPNRSWQLFSYPFFLKAREDRQTFNGVAAFQSFPNILHGTIRNHAASSESEQLSAQLVSGSYFDVLGVKPLVGRLLTESDDQTAGAHPVAVISYAFWEKRFGKDPSAVGSEIEIAGQTYTVTGVAPREFFGTTVGLAPDIYLSLAMEAVVPPNWVGRTTPLAQSLYLIGRLNPGTNEAQASSRINLLFKQFLMQESGASPAATRVLDIERARIEFTPAGRGVSELRREFSLSLKILMCLVGVVLFIACANLATLLLARSSARHREFAVRLAVGAGRVRLIRQLLTESLLLAAAGAIAGIGLSWIGSRVLILMASDGKDPLPIDVNLNLRVLAFTVLVSVAAAFLFGLAPALRAASIQPNASLRGRGAGSAISQTWLGRALVSVQVALSLVLLVGAGLFVRTLLNLERVDTGFDERNVLLFKIDSSAAGFKDDERLGALLREVELKVKQVPGVEAAAFSLFTFNQGAWSTRAFANGFETTTSSSRSILNDVVGHDFFAAMGIQLVAGRSFTEQDNAKSARVAVISEGMAQNFFPGVSAVGRRFGLSRREQDTEIEVIGVVRDARLLSISAQPRPTAYHLNSQVPSYLNNLVVRTTSAGTTLVPEIRRAVYSVNRNLPVDEVVTFSDHVDRSLVRPRVLARVAAFFSVLALALACIGLYGVLSYSVARRTNEIGVRMALGAGRHDVVWLVLRSALGVVVLGTAVGLVAAIMTTKYAATLLFGLAANDMSTIIASTLVLFLTAVLAGYLPARRASRVEPVIALRDE
jgi:predicted permease